MATLLEHYKLFSLLYLAIIIHQLLVYLLKSCFVDYDRENTIKQRAEYDDCRSNTANYGFMLDGLKLISRYQFNRNTSHRLRDRLGILLGHVILGHGEITRMMQL